MSGDSDVLTLELAVEDYAVSIRRVVGDTVRVSTSTRVTEAAIDEATVDEQVVVDRVPIGLFVDAAPAIRTEGDTTIVSVVREEVVVQRRLRLVEELHLRRVRVPGRHREAVSLREQVATVTRSGPATPEPRPATADSRPIGRPPSPAPNPSGAHNMSDQTIVAVYDTAAHAQSAVTDLKGAGVPEDAITVHARSMAGGSSAANAASTGVTGEAPREGFWASLFGGTPDNDAAVYDRSMDSGSTVVSVKAPDAYIDRVMAMLESHHPIDIDDRARSYGIAETTTTTTRQPVAAAPEPAATQVDDGRIQLSEERLAIGKRVVNRGGTRVRRFVVETPVEENVKLHSERVVLERRPVTDGRPVDDSFSDKTIEMTESAEEAVVSKTAHVVEEIGLRKETVDRVETVRDTVRKEEVEIVQVPGTATTGGAITDATIGGTKRPSKV